MAQPESAIVIQVTSVTYKKPDGWEKEEGKTVADVGYIPETVKGIGDGFPWARTIRSQGGGVGGSWIHVRGIPKGLEIQRGTWLTLEPQGYFKAVSETEPFFRI